MSFGKLRIRLRIMPACLFLMLFSVILSGQPACFITGGSDIICDGNSTIWSAPDGMSAYYWTGPSGFFSEDREISVSIAGEYTVDISDLNGISSCSRTLYIYPALSPGSINTDTRQFCVGGTTPIGGTNYPYGPASGGSGSYIYTWQLQVLCTGSWDDIPGTNTSSYTPAAPPVTTCYRRKVTDAICNMEAFTDFKTFEIFEDPVSQTIVPLPPDFSVCAGIPISATFTGGSGGFPDGTTDIYEYSTDSGATWSGYAPGENISTINLAGSGVVRVRTRRISTGVNGCNYGSYVTAAWSIKPVPVTQAIFHR
jgi:hypothetical protein